MKKRLMKLIRREEGASLVEYGLLLALIAVVCIAAVGFVGSAASDMFQGIVEHLTP